MSIRTLTKAGLLAAAFAAAPASPAPPQATEVAVTLASFRFSPDLIQLEHGRAYTLKLTNLAGGGHNFVAPDFFAAAGLDTSDRGRVHEGGIEVPGHGTVSLHITAPKAGRYKVRCTHTLHSTFGMKGAIVVT